MTLKRNSIEATPATTGITPTNSGGGLDVAFDTVNIGPGGTIVADTTRAAHGLQSAAVTGASGQLAFMSYTLTASTSASARCYIYLPTIPSVGLLFMQLRGPSTSVCSALVSSTGHMQMYDATAAAGEYTSIPTVTTGQWYRVEIAAQIGGTSTTGTLKMAFYLLDSTTAIETHTNSGGANTGTSTTITEARFGKVTTSTFTGTVSIDNTAAQDGTAGAFIGVPGPTTPTPPTGVSATPGVAAATVAYSAPGDNGGSAVDLYTATSSPGGVTGTAAGPGGGSIVVSGLTPGTAYTFTVTAHNAQGTGPPSASSNSVTPSASAQTVPPVSDVTTSGWSSSDSASVFATDLDESSPSDVDFVSSPTAPSGSPLEEKMAVVSTPADNNSWNLTVRMRFRNGSSGSAVVNVVDGTTVIASQTFTLTGSFANYTLSLTPTQGAAITDLTDIRGRPVVTAA